VTGEVVKSPRVIRDLTDHYVFLRQDNLNVVERFFAAADETFEQLARIPEMESPRDSGRSELSGLRMFRIRGFEKHLVFYRPIEGGVEILRVLHSARDVAALFED
jgi:toxin ParE1/3/4